VFFVSAAQVVVTLFVGLALWTILVTFTTPTTTWIIIAVGLALRRIPPGQELEEIAT
jgi:hypothetical protein